MRIVFMGTPDFAVESLEQLIGSSHELLGVVTNPDRASGRGRSKKPSPVKQKALEADLPVLQPEQLVDKDFLDQLRSWAPELIVVVAFRILPPEVLEIPKRGSINLHASLLPHYRGAAPIQRAIMNGERKSGVTSFFLDEGMDRGDILLQEEVEIPEDMTAGALHDELAERGSALLVRTIDRLEAGTLEPEAQDEGSKDLTKAPKIGKEDRELNWKLPAKLIHDRIRAMSPIPGVHSKLGREGRENLDLKILRSRMSEPESSSDEEAGRVLKVERDRLIVGTGQGSLELLRLQPSGKKEMRTDEFLKGYEVREGDRFE